MPRLDALTGLRWWAAFWVFTYHLRAIIAFPSPYLWPIEYGYLGVTFFFVLSGFVLTWSMSSSLSLSTFYTRRLARIWPSHIVALLLAIPVFYSFAPNPAQTWVKPFDPGVVALSVPLMQGWSRDSVVLFSGNPAAWTLSCELFFYALHPFIGRGLRRLRHRGALMAAVGSIAVAATYNLAVLKNPTEWWATSMPWPIVRLPEFVFGMAIAWALRTGWRPKLRLWPATVIFGAGLFLISVIPRYFPDWRIVDLATRFSAVVMTVLCGLVIIGAVVTTLQSRRTWLGSVPMVQLGTSSYAFYLLHATVIYAALNIHGPVSGRWPSIAWAVSIFGVALTVALLLHHFVEFRAERVIRRWKDGRDRQRAEPSLLK